MLFETDGSGESYVAIEGRARVAGELNDEVYGAIIERERQQDPGRKGIAVIVDVDSVVGRGREWLLSSDPAADLTVTDRGQPPSIG